ncbi:ABC transporter ATP-binding protein [Plantibacter sp. YIM 135249]|jgi:ABC-2 type transport system ATP-binding protein|uniref:ABC transporter ATP-binding protein n=1 Tax=Plantibacter sp. YIM 135249 TaxID=3423918 RepID=UPI003D34C128
MIEAHELTKRFGDKHAVGGVSFTVRPGVVTGFLGPNGAGKSTIMKLALGLQRPTSGSVSVNGSQYTRSSAPMRDVGALLDASWAHPRRSARNHLRAIGLSQGYGRSRVDQVLEQAGLASVAERNVGTFSLGMKQRLGIATALLGDPATLILDEPVNGLDPDGVIWIREFLRELAAEGRTVLLSSHLMSEMQQTADRIIVIGRGAILADGELQDIIAGGTEASVIVRSPRLKEFADVLQRAGAGFSVEDGTIRVSGASAADVGDLAAHVGIPLHELRSSERSLEDAYRQLVGDSIEHGAGARTELQR